MTSRLPIATTTAPPRITCCDSPLPPSTSGLKTSNDGLNLAHEIVASLLTQITLNDCPPSNDGNTPSFDIKNSSRIGGSASTVTDNTGAVSLDPSSTTRRKPLLSLPTRNPYESFTTPRNDAPSNALLSSALLSQRKNDSELGHTSLAEMCAMTLHNWQQTFLQSHSPPKMLSLVSSNSHSPPSVETTTPHWEDKRVFDFGWEGDGEESVSGTMWIGRSATMEENNPNVSIFASNSAVSVTAEQERGMDDKSVYDGDSVMSSMISIGDEGKEGLEVQMIPSSGNEGAVGPITSSEGVVEKKRIQMFGSEYARFLVPTAFAPAVSRRKPSLKASLIRLSPSTRSLSSKSEYLLSSAPTAVQSGAITDIIITHGTDAPPKGFYRVGLTGLGFKADLTLKCGGTSVYLNVKKEADWDRAVQRPCVTALAIIFPDRHEFVPPGFCVVRRRKTSSTSSKLKTPNNTSSPNNSHQPTPPRTSESNIPANLNFSTSGERIYLCFKRSREGNPLTGLLPLQPNKLEPIPDGYTVLERTPRNFVADVNTGAGPPLFLAIRQRLANLETLRPSTLVRHCCSERKMNAYYCTGGTVIGSDVGRFHVMDRSTHPILSPSSVTNRLCLIQASRERSSSADIVVRRRKKQHTPLSDGDSTSQQSSSITSSTPPLGGHSPMSSLSESASPYRDIPSNSLTMTSSTISATTAPLFEFIPTLTCASNPPICPLHTRIEVLTPILTSCYTHHGGAATLAVEGLLSLLSTNFFADDVRAIPSPALFSSLSLLDLSIQVVCDLATSSARETLFSPCVDFVSAAMQYSQGLVTSRTVGYVIRFYLFVFYFGASVPRGLGWNDDMLLLPGDTTGQGAPKKAVMGLKECVELVLAMDKGKKKKKKKRKKKQDVYDFIRSMMEDVVETSVQRVDVSNFTQIALHQIHRSGGSELFWHDMVSSCGHGLFSNDYSQVIAFAMLASLVKVASGTLRRIQSTNMIVPRDVSTKMLSLELLHHFLIRAPHQEEYSILSYTIRRLVVPCLLSNMASGIDDPRVFRRIVSVISCLFQHFRTHLKIELAVLIEHFFLQFLRLGPQVRSGYYQRKTSHSRRSSTYDQQLLILKELSHWFTYFPHATLSLYLNYDQNDSGVITQTQNRIFTNICSTIVTFSEQCGDILTEQINKTRISSDSNNRGSAVGHGDDGEEMAKVRDAARKLQNRSLETVVAVMKALMHVSWDVYKSGLKEGEKWREMDDFLKDHNVSEAGSESFDDRALFGSVDEESDDKDNIGLIDSTEGQDELVVTNHSEKVHDNDDGTNEGSASKECSDDVDIKEEMMDYWQHNIATERRRGGSLSDYSKITSQLNKTTGFKFRSQGGTTKPPLPNRSKQNPRLGIVPSHASVASYHPSPPPITNNNYTTNINNASSSSSIDQNQTAENIQVAFEIVSNKGLKKGIDYLIACHSLTQSPRDIASFLRIHVNALDSAVLGDYLGEGGHAGDGEFWNQLRYHYVRAISFVGMNVEEGLRHFLTRSGFRLPGEAQKIDRIITTFSQCFWEDNAGDHTRCPFRHQDTVFLLSFAIIMLNTDLHKSGSSSAVTTALPSLNSSSKRHRKKMTKQEFTNNLRGVDNAEDLSKDYLSDIYDSIDARPIAILDHVTKSPTHPAVATTAAASMSPSSPSTGSQTSIKSLVRRIKPSIELLRGLAVQTHPFASPTIDMPFLHSLLQSIWHHFHSLINSTLDAVQLDPRAIISCLDLLQYVLATTIFLQLKVEGMAFLQQLARIKFLKDRGMEDGARLVLCSRSQLQQNEEELRQEEWYCRFVSCWCDHDEVLHAVEGIYGLVQGLRGGLRVDSNCHLKMRNVTKRIRNGQMLLNDPSRFFIHHGDLAKRCNRSGRYITYHFFLFSDVLIYTHLSKNGEFKIHEELPLYLMKIRGEPSNTRKEHSFQIHHPKKSFLVCASSENEKTTWVECLRGAVERAVERKAGLKGLDETQGNDSIRSNKE